MSIHHDASDAAATKAAPDFHADTYAQVFRDLHPMPGQTGRANDNAAAKPASPESHNLPNLSITDGNKDALVHNAQHTLTDGKASAADKLHSVQDLAKAGVKDIQLTDNNGQMRDYAIHTDKTRNGEMVHLYGKDDHGKEQIALRGITNADGTVSREKDARGHEVGYEGSSWAKKENGKTSVGITGEAGRGGSDNVTPKPADTMPPKPADTMPPKPADSVPPPKPADSVPPPNPADSVPPPNAPDHTKPNDKTNPGDKPTAPEKAHDADVISQHTSKGTGYYPADNAMEGGKKDRLGQPLHTLQDYLSGKAPYVSVAMDSHAGIPYGQKVNIPEINEKYGQKIPFRVVDTGGAFQHKGTSKIDICVANNKESHDAVINRQLTLQFTK